MRTNAVGADATYHDELDSLEVVRFIELVELKEEKSLTQLREVCNDCVRRGRAYLLSINQAGPSHPFLQIPEEGMMRKKELRSEHRMFFFIIISSSSLLLRQIKMASNDVSNEVIAAFFPFLAV